MGGSQVKIWRGGGNPLMGVGYPIVNNAECFNPFLFGIYVPP